MTMPSDEGTRGAFPLRHSNTASGGGRSIAAVPCGMINISKTGGAVGKWSSEIKNVWSTAYDASYHLTRAENMLNKAEKLEKSGDSIDHAVAKQLKEKAKVELGKFGDAAKQNEQAVNAAIRANASADDIHNAQDSGQEAGEKDANDANDAGQANGNPDQPPETNHEAATPRWDDDSNSGGGAGNCGEAWEQCVGGNEGGGGSDNDCEGKFSNTLLGKKNDNSPILPSDDATSVGICGENGGGGIDAKFLFNSTGLGTYDPSPLDGPGSEPTGGGDPTPAPYSPYSPIKEMKQMLK
ncbi:MAG: hypothetical protein HYT75_03310 [Deltaproteobacteria bacterium]|nr:hypothetical protein [Deltaproteobacteria bacterium]